MTIDYVSEPGENPPPVPAGPKLCNGDEMRILHNAFLWAYQEASGLVRSVTACDKARAEFVGTWLADMDATLHVHHKSEDAMLWDRIAERAPACALHVGQMRAHHAQVAELLEAAAPLLREWRTTADRSTGEKLAQAYEAMLAVLKVHLRREVVEIVPVAEKVLTQKEWSTIAEHSIAVIPKSRLMPQLGQLLANSSPADRAEFFATLPGLVKVLYRVVGRRQYARQFQQLFPDRPVPTTA